MVLMMKEDSSMRREILKTGGQKMMKKKLNSRADIMIKQFGKYVVTDTFKINGKATLSENIADLGGILLGWDAFKNTGEYKKNEKIGPYSFTALLSWICFGLVRAHHR